MSVEPFARKRLHIGAFYFGAPDQAETKNRRGVSLEGILLVGAFVLIVAAIASQNGVEDDESLKLGVDRPAEEDEYGRRVREQEGGRSREAVEGVGRRWKSMSDEELIAYYREHYGDMTRGKLATVDRSFYQALRKRDLLEEVSVSNRDWNSMTDDELRAYYREHYAGVSRGKLCSVDGSFCNTLRKRGLIDEIPVREWKPAE